MFGYILLSVLLSGVLIRHQTVLAKVALLYTLPFFAGRGKLRASA